MHFATRKVLNKLTLQQCLSVKHYSTSVRQNNVTKLLTQCSGKQLFTSEALMMIYYGVIHLSLKLYLCV